MTPRPRPRIRLLIVDDHEIVREGLRALFGTVPSVEVVGGADTAAAAVALADTLEPDVVVMDSRLGPDSGITACHEIVRRHPGTRVIVLTGYPDPVSAAAAIRAGAAGYVLKQSTAESLIQAVKGGRSESVVDAEVLRHLASTGDVRAEHLAPDERRLAGLVAEGLTNAEIAACLGLPVPTVKAHVSRLLAKLGAEGRAEVGPLLRAAVGPPD
ncbi:MAG: response regulator transcription factor [Chloroflexota bacterium]